MSEPAVTGRAVLALARKEFSDYTRRPWIIVLASLLALLALAAGYVAGFGGPGGDPLLLTILALRGIAGLLVPLMAIVLAHSALAGEQESGSLALLLAQPVTRAETLLGKFVGLYAVLASAIVLGFGGAGVVIAVRSGSSEWGAYARFLLATLAYTGAYFALFLMLSALLSRRTPALFAGLGLAFFFSALYNPLLFVAAFRFGGPEAFASPPAWYVALTLLSVPNLYSSLMASILAGADGAGVDDILPGAVPEAAVAWSLLGVIAVAALGVALWALDRKDV